MTNNHTKFCLIKDVSKELYFSKRNEPEGDVRFSGHRICIFYLFITLAQQFVIVKTK